MIWKHWSASVDDNSILTAWISVLQERNSECRVYERNDIRILAFFLKTSQLHVSVVVRILGLIRFTTGDEIRSKPCWKPPKNWNGKRGSSDCFTWNEVLENPQSSTKIFQYRVTGETDWWEVTPCPSQDNENRFKFTDREWRLKRLWLENQLHWHPQGISDSQLECRRLKPEAPPAERSWSLNAPDSLIAPKRVQANGSMSSGDCPQ